MLAQLLISSKNSTLIVNVSYGTLYEEKISGVDKWRYSD